MGYQEDRVKYAASTEGREERRAEKYAKEAADLRAALKRRDDDNRRLQSRIYDLEDEVSRLRAEHPLRARIADLLEQVAERLR